MMRPLTSDQPVQSASSLYPWGVLNGMISHPHQQHSGTSPAIARDPVCGMNVDPGTGGRHSQHLGRTYHYCSEHCQAKFDAEPAAYAAGSDRTLRSVESAAVAAGEEDEYTCSMHPEIRQTGPGACPICGMALEPVVVTADTGPSAELADMRRRFWIALVLSIPVVALEMGGHLSPRCTGWCPRRCRRGCSWFWRHRWCCGRAGRSSSGAGCRSARSS